MKSIQYKIISNIKVNLSEILLANNTAEYRILRLIKTNSGKIFMDLFKRVNI